VQAATSTPGHRFVEHRLSASGQTTAEAALARVMRWVARMRASLTLPVSLAATFAVLAFGCVAHGNGALAGRGALHGGSYAACGKGGDYATARSMADRFACAGYGSANQCAISGMSAYDGYDGRGAANMQPGRAAARSLNPALPYSTDDNDPNFLYNPGIQRPARLDSTGGPILASPRR
jgi:hypothetical protein